MSSYTLAPHSLLEMGNNLAMVSRETRGWALVSKENYYALKEYFSRENGICGPDERETLERLYSLGLARKNGYYPDYCSKKPPENPESLLIKITGDCNFECAYCYDFSASRKGNRLSKERILSVIDGIMERTGRLNITFHGGEPLLQFERIKEIVGHCEERYESAGIRYAVQTNGSRLDGEKIEFLDEHDFSVGISVDGIWDSTDGLRRSKDSSRKASEMLLSLVQRHNDFVRTRCGVLTVLCRSSLERLPEFVLWLQEHGVGGFSTTVLDPTGRARNMEDEGISPDEIIGLYKTWIQMIKAGEIHSIKISNLLSYIDNLYSFDPPNFCQKGPCGASGEFLVLDSDGSLRSCDCVIHDYFVLGGPGSSLESAIGVPGKRANIVERYEWLARHSECSKCSWLQLCGGTCAAKALGFSDDINFIYPIECELSKFLYTTLLNEFSQDPDGPLFRYHKKHTRIKRKT